jgi:hypothetical protein
MMYKHPVNPFFSERLERTCCDLLLLERREDLAAGRLSTVMAAEASTHLGMGAKRIGAAVGDFEEKSSERFNPSRRDADTTDRPSFGAPATKPVPTQSVRRAGP